MDRISAEPSPNYHIADYSERITQMHRTIYILPLAVPILLLACNNSELLHASYANLEAARDDGAITRGWIHPFVPPSATNILEAHDLDTNTQCLTFNFHPDDRAQILQYFQPILEQDIPWPDKGPVRATSWWPVQFQHPHPLKIESHQPYQFSGDAFRSISPDMRAYLILDTTNNQVWFWTTRQ